MIRDDHYTDQRAETPSDDPLKISSAHIDPHISSPENTQTSVDTPQRGDIIVDTHMGALSGVSLPPHNATVCAAEHVLCAVPPVNASPPPVLGAPGHNVQRATRGL